ISMSFRVSVLISAILSAISNDSNSHNQRRSDRAAADSHKLVGPDSDTVIRQYMDRALGNSIRCCCYGAIISHAHRTRKRRAICQFIEAIMRWMEIPAYLALGYLFIGVPTCVI